MESCYKIFSHRIEFVFSTERDKIKRKRTNEKRQKEKPKVCACVLLSGGQQRTWKVWGKNAECKGVDTTMQKTS